MPYRKVTSTRTWSGKMTISGNFYGSDYNPIYVCEACGGEVKNPDQVGIQIGKESWIYFHKICYIDPDNQSMIRSLVVAEDVIGI